MARRWIPRSFKVVPLALASAILFVVLSVLGLLNFSTGSGESDTVDPSPESAVAEQAPEETAELPQVAVVPEDVEEPDDSDASPEPLALLDVLIDGDLYWVSTQLGVSDPPRELRGLPEILAASEIATGDNAGVKVRVSRTFNATAQAEWELMAGLKDVGMSEDEIDQRRTLVPPPGSQPN